MKFIEALEDRDRMVSPRGEEAAHEANRAEVARNLTQALAEINRILEERNASTGTAKGDKLRKAPPDPHSTPSSPEHVESRPSLEAAPLEPPELLFEVTPRAYDFWSWKRVLGSNGETSFVPRAFETCAEYRF